MFDLFAALDANEDQLDFPVLYGSAKQEWMAREPNGAGTGPQDNMDPHCSIMVLEQVSAPPEAEDGPNSACWRPRSSPIPFLGRILTGRVKSPERP